MKTEKELYQWDNDVSEETLVFRKLMWEDIKVVLNSYKKSVLKEVFLKYYFKFDRRNQNFWKKILKVKEDEIKKRSERKFNKDSGSGTY